MKNFICEKCGSTEFDALENPPEIILICTECGCYDMRVSLDDFLEIIKTRRKKMEGK